MNSVTLGSASADFEMQAKTTDRIAIFLRCLGGGGAERAMVNLANTLARQGYRVDMVLSTATGKWPLLGQVSPTVRIVDLKAPSLTRSLFDLVKYLRREQPAALLSTLHYSSEIAIWAQRLSGVPMRVVVREANNLSRKSQGATRWKERIVPLFVRRFYPWADCVIAISSGVAEDLIEHQGLSSDRVRVIYSPVITPDLQAKAAEAIDHPWLQPGQPPVVLGVGKLQPQKDFPTLIRAFAEVRRQREARLMILGWGPDRPQLEALVRDLGIENDVEMPGFVQNPFAYMSKAAVFVMSSGWEGFGNVLVEAMAVGTPVISTNCESGPTEILDGGKYGRLTPVGDSQAMAEAILAVLSEAPQPVDPVWLEQFTAETSTRRYLEALGIR